jgi:hypothetical protein
MSRETDRAVLMDNMQGIEHAPNICTRQKNNMLNLDGEVWKHTQKCFLQDTAQMSPNKIRAKFQDYKPQGGRE